MKDISFPTLASNWQETRNSIQKIAQLIGTFRQALSPVQKHWWHISLQKTVTGFTTTPIPSAGGFSLSINLVDHYLGMEFVTGPSIKWSTAEVSMKTLAEGILGTLKSRGVIPVIDHAGLKDDSFLQYDVEAAQQINQTFFAADAILKAFKATLRQESSPVQTWPHHFDMAIVWFSGRLVAGQDPANADYADEQMGFGFSSGDSMIPEPYFYVSAYPMPENLAKHQMPAGFTWLTEGFTGAVVKISELPNKNQAAQTILDGLIDLRSAGGALMVD